MLYYVSNTFFILNDYLNILFFFFQVNGLGDTFQEGAPAIWKILLKNELVSNYKSHENITTVVF